MGDLMSKAFIDPNGLPSGMGGFIQVSFLGLAYGAILCNASNMIAEGSELLLLVPALAGIVGPVVLPILGAVPDGAIVLFSGLGPDAQDQLAVGVGALAGSTIMLLTIPWFLSVVGGRVDIKDGVCQYKRPRDAAPDWKKLTPGNWSLTGSGVSGSPYVSTNGMIMLITACSYPVIQLPVLYASYFPGVDTREIEGIAAGIGMLVCGAAFCGYLYFQFNQAYKGEDKQVDWRNVQIRIKAIKDMNFSLRAVLSELRKLQEVRSLKRNHEREIQQERSEGDASLEARKEEARIAFGSQPLLACREVPEKFKQLLRDVLRPFFDAHDNDRNGLLDMSEVKHLFHELNEYPSEEQLSQTFRSFDVDQSCFLDFEEFLDTMIAYLLHPQAQLYDKTMGVGITLAASTVADTSITRQLSIVSEEAEEVPEDLAHLPPEEQQKYIKRRAFTMMFIGTALVLTFSDPMVGVFSEMGKRTSIPSFYISFILAPLASNASELLASYSYSLKKTKKSIEISFSSLQGAGCMNNTFCLGVFFALIYFRGLVWKYSAEVIAILVVEVLIAFVSQSKLMTLLIGLCVLALFPLSLCLVAFLNNYVGMG